MSITEHIKNYIENKGKIEFRLTAEFVNNMQLEEVLMFIHIVEHHNIDLHVIYTEDITRLMVSQYHIANTRINDKVTNIFPLAVLILYDIGDCKLSINDKLYTTPDDQTLVQALKYFNMFNDVTYHIMDRLSIQYKSDSSITNDIVMSMLYGQTKSARNI